MTDLTLEVAMASAADFFNMTTAFLNLLNNADEVNVYNFYHFIKVIMILIIIGLYIKFRNLNDNLTEYSILLFIGFLYVERNFEGPQKYMLIFVLMVFLALLVYMRSTELQNRQSKKFVIEPKPN
ncbi:hypothetical protein BPOR_1465g00010 [Botrytis porri]|uniref:Uncharacterized protein n=1 Tax=Botrytis porri TaxID=87229 RepID=A0A4Z1K637_9HELO|nr:hypothetical protein BPOR_1465g00010 [Botrytis porri]